MILYCYTDRKHLRACRTSGIEHGVIPYTMIPRHKGRANELVNWNAFQWLTTNSQFIDINSSEGPPKTAVLMGRKQEFRITVRIPHYGRGRLRKWLEYAKVREIPLRSQINIDLGNPAEWFVYAGVIPSKWFVEIARNPSAPDWVAPEVERQSLPMDTSGRGIGTDSRVTPMPTFA